MKLFIKILLLLLLPAFVQAQQRQKQSDSLHLALKNADNDTIRMDVYNGLAYFFTESNADSAVFYFEKESLLASQLKLKINQTEALDMKGYILSKQGNYPKSLETFMQAMKIAEDPASEKNTWHLSKGRTPRFERLSWLGWVNTDIGPLYHSTGNADKEISGYLKAKSIAESIHNNYLLSFANAGLGRFYMDANKLDSALFFEKKAQEIFLKSGEKYGGYFLNTIGQIYQKQGNFDLSRDAFTKAIKVNEEVNNLSSLGDSYVWLAGLYQPEKKADSSLFYARKGVETYKEVERPDGIASAYSLLSSIYTAQNKTDSAFKYLKLATTLNDSINNKERKNLLAFQDVGFDEQLRLEELEKEKIETQTKIRTYVLLAGIVVFMLIAFLLYRNTRNRKKANYLLLNKNVEIEQQKKTVEGTLVELKSTQSQLIQSEKMASLGELTAGIAHEIQNPLNFVNNFSEVSNELIDEMNEELNKGDIKEAKAISSDIKQNLEKINHHGKRADAIVKGMLQHSRSSTGVKEPTDINALADEYLRLTYQGLRAKDKDFNAEMVTDFDETIGKINMIPQDIGRVLLNLFNNAFYAVNEKEKLSANSYQPAVSVTTEKSESSVLITVSDNGNGIPKNIVDKIFQPFFTTKPTGSGTGLGLSLSYDIIKAHGGEIKVESKEGEGSEFLIQLPINN